MEEAYRLASANGTLPANARQIMYQARPRVLAATNGKCWKESSYFTQTLLPDYVSEHPAKTADWDVVYDARGHFVEPHVQQKLGIGTLEVRTYINSWASRGKGELDILINELFPTSGPENRYKNAMFIEKEGFDPLLDRSQIASKYDLAIFSSKGQSVTAARQLVDTLSQAGVSLGSTQVSLARTPDLTIERASSSVGIPHTGKIGCNPEFSSCFSRYARMSVKKRSPKAMHSMPD
jgi:hypothetical protein